MINPNTSSLLLQAAAAAAGAQQYPAGTLYVVATPIGNLADLTLRAIHVLSIADAIACEDTRHTVPLLRHLGLDKPLLAAHEHNEREAARDILTRLERGERVAYVSDAGTPAISDPGAALVAAARSAGYATVPVPGACSAAVAMSVAGDVKAAGFRFVGFLSSRPGEREQALNELAASTQSAVLFEAPHRIEALAAALATACGDRNVTLLRELTKQFETIVTLPARALVEWLAADANRRRGEFVLVVHAREADAVEDADAQHDAMLSILLADLPLKQAVSLCVQLSGAPRNLLYSRALALKGKTEN